MKSHRVKHKQQPKWITQEIIDCIKARDRYKALNNEIQYKILRNKVITLIKQSKKAQYSALINENANKPASVWKLFKEIGVNKRNVNSGISSIKVGQHDIDDDLQIANEFNKFFVTVASNLKQPVETSNFEKLKTFCDSKIPENTEFKIPEMGREKV